VGTPPNKALQQTAAAMLLSPKLLSHGAAAAAELAVKLFLNRQPAK